MIGVVKMPPLEVLREFMSVPKVGLEPTRVLPHRILSPARLPSVWCWADIGMTCFSGILQGFTVSPAVVRIVVALG
jgi:hypothetical protein